MAKAQQEVSLAQVDNTEHSFDLLVVFSLDEQEYGLMAHNVREIIRIRNTTRVPNSPPKIQGVINLRGQIIPVFNLRTCLGIKQITDASAANQAVMVIEIEDMSAGLLVDSVADVVKIEEEDIDRSTQLIESGMAHQFIEGTVKLGSRLVTLLMLRSLLEA